MSWPETYIYMQCSVHMYIYMCVKAYYACIQPCIYCKYEECIGGLYVYRALHCAGLKQLWPMQSFTTHELN